MTVHPMPEPVGGHTQPDVVAVGIGGRDALEPAPQSVLDLLNRTLADSTRTTNATQLVTATSRGIARVLLAAGLTIALMVALAAVLIHFAGLGPALGGAVATGGTAAVAGGRYLWKRRRAANRSRRR